jgi:hypothetical protein
MGKQSGDVKEGNSNSLMSENQDLTIQTQLSAMVTSSLSMISKFYAMMQHFNLINL